MNIKPILMRLQSALGQTDLMEQMLLLPGNAPANNSIGAANFAIGYNGSPNSQTALDFVLWIAHQTRMATQRQVTVHVIYVLESLNSLCTGHPTMHPSLEQPNVDVHWHHHSTSGAAVLERDSATSTIAPALHPHSLEHADQILWQARCLAEEWRGSLEVHLRFGDVATELQQVLKTISADLLFVGCSSLDHPLIQQFNPPTPCAVLGIPAHLESEGDSL